MIVFIAGATGAVGRPLVQQLASAGHEVIGTTRSAEKLRHLRSAGATGVVVDARDSDYDARSSQRRRMSSSTSSPTWHNRCDPADSATG
jgi:uncharacterized protein YbjT (DUF2867 family)